MNWTLECHLIRVSANPRPILFEWPLIKIKVVPGLPGPKIFFSTLQKWPNHIISGKPFQKGKIWEPCLTLVMASALAVLSDLDSLEADPF